MLLDDAAAHRFGFFGGIFLKTLPQPDGFIRTDGCQDGAVRAEGHVQDAAFVAWKAEQEVVGHCKKREGRGQLSSNRSFQKVTEPTFKLCHFGK